MSNAAAGGGGAGSAVVGTASGMPLSAEYPVDVLSGQRNPRGIPQMLFFDEDLAAFFTSRRAPVRAPARACARARPRVHPRAYACAESAAADGGDGRNTRAPVSSCPPCSPAAPRPTHTSASASAGGAELATRTCRRAAPLS
jgi:hypothetical protein